MTHPSIYTYNVIMSKQNDIPTNISISNAQIKSHIYIYTGRKLPSQLAPVHRPVHRTFSSVFETSKLSAQLLKAQLVPQTSNVGWEAPPGSY